jgi:hypothetical protein
MEMISAITGTPVNSVESRLSKKEVRSGTLIRLTDGRAFRVSDRFWNSLYGSVGVSGNRFYPFSFNEVMRRLTSMNPNRLIRLTVQPFNEPVINANNSHHPIHGVCLATSQVGDAVVTLEQVADLASKYHALDLRYGGGTAQLRFDCAFPMEFRVQNDEMRTNFMMEIPVDGAELPAVYLLLMRMVCSNGLVAYSPTFRSTFNLGSSDSSDWNPVLSRAVELFNNEEGFHALKDRYTSSSVSWASLYELDTARIAMHNASIKDRMSVSDFRAVDESLIKAANNPHTMYGVVSEKEISQRRAKVLPVKFSCYDLMNFMTEFSTHKLKSVEGRRMVDSYIGSMMASEFCLENSKRDFPDFAATFLHDLKTANNKQEDVVDETASDEYYESDGQFDNE